MHSLLDVSWYYGIQKLQVLLVLAMSLKSSSDTKHLIIGRADEEEEGLSIEPPLPPVALVAVRVKMREDSLAGRVKVWPRLDRGRNQEHFQTRIYFLSSVQFISSIWF